MSKATKKANSPKLFDGTFDPPHFIILISIILITYHSLKLFNYISTTSRQLKSTFGTAFGVLLYLYSEHFF